MSATSYTAPTNNPTAEPSIYHCTNHHSEATYTTFPKDPNAEPTTTPASSCNPNAMLPCPATGPSNSITTDSTVSTTSCSLCYPT